MNDPEVTMLETPSKQLIALSMAIEAAGVALSLVLRVPAPFKSLADQVVRSAGSVAANLSEGHGRFGRDRLDRREETPPQAFTRAQTRCETQGGLSRPPRCAAKPPPPPWRPREASPLTTNLQRLFNVDRPTCPTPRPTTRPTTSPLPQASSSAA